LTPREKRAAPPDLARLADEALERVRDPRRIWCRPALSFATRLDLVNGVLLGGAHSPLFLGTDHTADPVTRRLPAGLVASRVRVLETPCATGPLDRWLGFLESLREAQESLIVVTPEAPDPELLETFVVNTHRRTLVACAVFPGPGASPPVADEHAALAGAGLPPSAETRESLPLFGLAMIRRDATVLLDGAPETEDAAIAMVHVGGRDFDDVQARMTGMMKLVTTRRGSMTAQRD
jgi:hypothetical protein